jgi:hypothetical protein
MGPRPEAQTDKEDAPMVATKQDTRKDSASRLIDTIEDAEQSAIAAVRKFVDAIDDVFPAIREDAPRRKIIDSAFRMVEQLASASNHLAKDIVTVTDKAPTERETKAPPPRP